MGFYIGFYAYAIIGHTQANQLLPQLCMEQFDTIPIQCRHIEHIHEGVWFRKNIFWQNDSCENLDNFSLIGLLYKHRWCLHGPINSYLRQLFPYMAFVYAWIVPLWADQLLPQLLMEQFDTLPIQCRHTEHMHEGVYNFCLRRFYWSLLFKTKVCWFEL